MLLDLFKPLSMKIAGGIGAISTLACLLLFIMYQSASHDAEMKGEALKLAAAEIAALKLDAELKEQAAIERANDGTVLDTQEDELSHANLEDDPNMRRLRNLCVRLRQQGRDISDHPACSRFETSAGAGDS